MSYHILYVLYIISVVQPTEELY